MISISGAAFLEFEAQMSTTQLLIRLPDELARRLKRSVAPRQRSKFIQRLLEEALPLENGDDDPLYRAAMAVEKEEALAAEMDEWETATIEDGFTNGSPERHGDRSK
jgi:predicted transcriptional regulator